MNNKLFGPGLSGLRKYVNTVNTGTVKNVIELHDRLIAASGKYLKIPILTCDRSIQESNAIRTIWADDL